MTRRPHAAWTLAALALLGVCALLSNTVLFRQSVHGDTNLTRNIPRTIGGWELVDEAAATPSEIQGLETSDIIKRTYSNGRSYMELVVAYIAHSSRKSAHAQEACLRGAGASVGSIASVDMAGGDGGGGGNAGGGARVSAKLISIDLRERRQWVCYWYKIGDRYTADYLKSSLLMFFEGLMGRKHQGASLVRLLTPEARGETQDQIRARIQDFTRFLTPELEKQLP